MPGKPKVTVEKGERDDPWVRSITAEVDFDPLYFGVSYNEFTEASVDGTSWPLPSAWRRASSGARSPRETTITMNGFPGLDYRRRVELLSMAMRVVLIPERKRSISAMVSGDGRLSANPSVRRFLNSFKLLP